MKIMNLCNSLNGSIFAVSEKGINNDWQDLVREDLGSTCGA